jgi:sirohydrochlorin ferrochelatase
MVRVVDLIRARDVFSVVQVGYLECNEPAIPDAIDACVAAGATSVVAVPYFLHTGTHVAEDLPSLLDAARERHPGVDFRLGAYIGRSPAVSDILADRARKAAAGP